MNWLEKYLHKAGIPPADHYCTITLGPIDSEEMAISVAREIALLSEPSGNIESGEEYGRIALYSACAIDINIISPPDRKIICKLRGEMDQMRHLRAEIKDIARIYGVTLTEGEKASPSGFSFEAMKNRISKPFR